MQFPLCACSSWREFQFYVILFLLSLRIRSLERADIVYQNGKRCARTEAARPLLRNKRTTHVRTNLKYKARKADNLDAQRKFQNAFRSPKTKKQNSSEMSIKKPKEVCESFSSMAWDLTVQQLKFFSLWND